MAQDYPAWILRQTDDKSTTASYETISPDDLPAGEVMIRVAYSSLNYKDGLALTGRGRVIRDFPMVPGIDLAGTVMASEEGTYQPGDEVIVTGWGLGEKHWGGYAGVARVPAAWLVPLPDGLTLQQAMALGTAGFTAALAIDTLEDAGLTPADGEVVVTGASGGAGGVAVALLAAAGYTVTASTGREANHDYLRGLGASSMVGRFDAPSRPLASSRWAAAVDGVGGETLAALLTELNYGSAVAAYGLAGGSDLNTSVFPFILRGVRLLGVDSVRCPQAPRQRAWSRLAAQFPPGAFTAMMQVHPLAEAHALAERILAGDVRGRVVLEVPA